MAEWDDGYVSDVTYTSGFHRESAPVWIATAAALTGFHSPDLARPFRFADLGCGYGVTALVVAATMPHAEVWGFDFNPAHIATAREIARRAGLSNIRFEEASFDDLRRLPREALPMFDYIAAHGILSWISLDNRLLLFELIGQRLTPGGIAYISYNVATGWVGVPPIRTLMRLLAEVSAERSDLKVGAIFEVLDQMRQAGAAMFQTHPSLWAWLTGIRGGDQRYVAHELLNRDGYPVMFRTVASAMAEIKCDYIASATLRDNISGLTIPPALYETVDQAGDTILRETLRDICCAAAFRRDLYQRGPMRLTPIEHERRTDAIALVRTFLPVPETIVLEGALGKFTANQALYRSLLKCLERGPTTVGRLRSECGLDIVTAREVTTLLLSAGYAAPMLPGPPTTEAVAAASRLNAVHAEAYDIGHDQPFLAYAALGAAWATDVPDIMALDELRSVAEQDVARTVIDRLKRTGRLLHQGGRPITDTEAFEERVTEMINDMVHHRLPIMRLLGAVEDVTAKAG
jgi:SAM-dependent methyltransferase